VRGIGGASNERWAIGPGVIVLTLVPDP